MLDRESRRGLYRWLWEDADAVVESGADGRTEIRDDEARQSEFWMLSRIEEFVDDVLESKLPAYRLDESEPERSRLVTLPLAKHLNAVTRFSWPTRAEVQYSARVQLFVDCWLQLGLYRDNLRLIREPSSVPEKKTFQRFNDLIRLIRVKATEPAFRKTIYEREKTASRSALSATQYIERLQRHDPGLQVVALELLYRDFTGGAYSRAKQDLRRFLNNLRRKPTLFSACVGHVWILRWSSTKGWHFYAYLFFGSATGHSGRARAADVGSYWENAATVGRGRWVPRYFTIQPDPDLQGDQIRSTIREVRSALESDVCFRVKLARGGRAYGRAEEKLSFSIGRQSAPVESKTD